MIGIKFRSCKILCWIFLTISLVLWSFHAYGEEWQQFFGGTDNEMGYEVIQTFDGGYLIVGERETISSGDVDVYVIKTDQAGNEQWTSVFGESSLDVGYSVQQTADQGYIIAGYTLSPETGTFDVYLIKIDTNGDEEWSTTIGEGYSHEHAYSIRLTDDGGFIIVGTIEFLGEITGDSSLSVGPSVRNVYLLKTNGAGEKQWSRNFGGIYDDVGISVQQTSDGGYILTGYITSSALAEDVYVIKTDADGFEVWSTSFGGSSFDGASSIQQTIDGGYIAAGSTTSYGAGGYDFYLMKMSSNGAEEWTKTFGGTLDDEGRSVQQTTDGGYIIAGTTTVGPSGKEVYLIKTYPNGEEQWSEIFDANPWDECNSVRQTIDGGYIMAGWTVSPQTIDSDIYLIYYRPESTGWSAAYNSMFTSTSDLSLFRQYRDQVLNRNTTGRLYTTLLYRSSDEALEVLQRNPSLMSQARSLIIENNSAISRVLKGKKGVIQNPEKVIEFLDAFSEKSSPTLRILVEMVRMEMIRKQKQGREFLGFKLGNKPKKKQLSLKKQL